MGNRIVKTIKAYSSIVRNMLITTLNFRIDFIFRLLGNIIYIILIYYLWKAIYAGQDQLKGLSFPDAFAYLGISSTIFVMVNTSMDWFLSSSIIHGRIMMDLILPLDYHMYLITRSAGIFINGFTTSAIPSTAFLIFVFNVHIPGGINILLGFVSLVFSFLISANFNFITGSLAFSSQSIWGIKIIKDNTILFLSGAIIPIQFFPAAVQPLLMALPFQTMFHTPAMVFLGRIETAESIKLILLQIGWTIALYFVGRFFFHKLKVKITINGG